MTLIFGARCTDGVVIVSDRLMMYGETKSLSANKIRKCGDFQWAIFAAAGEVTLYEEFLTRLPEVVNRTQSWINYQNAKNEEERKKDFGTENEDAPRLLQFSYTVETFKQDCVTLLNDMVKRYERAFENDDDCMLQIFIGVNTNAEAQLFYLDSVNCRPFEVKDAHFIGQRHLVEVFRKAWNDSMNMTQSAKLGAFAIKYTEMAELSAGVGVGQKGQGAVQLWVIPDGKPPLEITGEILDNFNKEVSDKVEKVFNDLNSLFRS
jgi:hypothetical protein